MSREVAESSKPSEDSRADSKAPHISLWCCASHDYKTVSSREGEGVPAAPRDWKKTIIGALLVFGCIFVVCGVLDLLFDFGARGATVAAMSYAFGVETSLEDLDTNLFSSRFVLRNIVVENPAGMSGHAMELDRVVIDFDAPSFLFLPIHLQVMSLHNLHVILKKPPGSKSNLDSIIEHASAAFHDNDTIIQKLQQFDSFKKSKVLMVADKVHFKNLTITANISGKISHHHVRQVLVTDIGRKQRGIRIYAFLEVIVRAIVKAVAMATSHEIQRGVVHSVEASLDYGAMQIDTGAGWASTTLETIGNSTTVVGEVVSDAVAAVATAVGKKTWGQSAASWIGNVTSNMSASMKKLGKNTKKFFNKTAGKIAGASDDIKKGAVGEAGPLENLMKD